MKTHVCWLLAVVAAHCSLTAQEKIIKDWKTWPSPGVTLSAATAERSTDGWLMLRAQRTDNRSGLALAPEQSVWNLEGFQEVAVPVRNLGDKPVRVLLRVDDAASSKQPDERVTRAIYTALLAPGQPAAWLRVPLGDRQQSKKQFIGMIVTAAGTVGQPLDLVPGPVSETGITGISLLLLESGDTPRAIAIGPLVARGTPLHRRKADYGLPFIDTYGQYIRREWPDKVHTDADLARQREREKTDLAAHARPSDWDRYGGWAKGPQREATGFFRVEKIDGQWWLIDPEGRLFWSHGVVRVGTRVRVGTVYRGTPILDRESYFVLPPRDGPFGQFYDTEPQATRGYYFGKEGHAVYDHLEANLFRKYGPNWREDYSEVAQRRLASWGLNTIANSSDPHAYLMRRTPYTAIIYSVPLGRSDHTIAGAAQGAWVKFPDPFDPGLQEGMKETLRTSLKDVLNDPWCLGVFVDNEMHFGDSCFLAEAVLASPPEQHAKIAFVAELKQKYGTVEKLNAAWATTHADWTALLNSTAKPDREHPSVRTDLENFSERILDRYFGSCREVIKAASPHHMYLGCRFAGIANLVSANPAVLRLASRYCDIVSINRYARTVEDLRLPDGIDRPIVIGEFSFGALDRGKFLANNTPVVDQTERGLSYRRYLHTALRNPAIVGTHWFQFYDQPTSARFDGENMQHGLIDVCDTPYPETVAAIRDIGASLYQIRSAAKPAAP